MDIVYNDITLDFSDNDSMTAVRVKQNDDRGRVIRVAFANNGASFSVSGSLPKLYASTEGIATVMGELLSFDTSARVLIPVTAALSAIAGVGHCEIRFQTTEGVVHSARFTLLVGELSATSDMPRITVGDDLTTQAGRYIRNFIELQHFRDTRKTYHAEADSSTSSLMDNPPKITISTADYNPEKDWIFMFKNDYEFVPYNSYTLDTETIPNGTMVLFDTTKISFVIGDSLDVLLFHSSQPDVYPLTQTEYDDLDEPDAETLYVITGD